MNNLQGVHNEEGYAFWTEQVLALDKLNPEIAARLTRAFDNWARYAPPYRDALRRSFERLQQEETLSRNVSEIVSKALNV
jgi:aminopeptidase N